MAPPSITEDYYFVLEVSQTATLDQITKSYRRLALKIHPDRNARDLHGATQDRRKQKIYDDEMNRRHQWDRTHGNIQFNGRWSNLPVYAGSSSVCGHRGWWDKVEGRTACPECGEVWTYLLECPGCRMHACPKCQYNLRHGLPRGTAGSSRGGRTRRPRTPEPAYDLYTDYWD